MPIYVYDCGQHVSEIFVRLKTGRLWPVPVQADAPRQIPCLECKRKAKRIIIAPYVNDDLPVHDQTFKELVPHDWPTRKRWEAEGRVIFENGIPKGRARSKAEFREMLRSLNRSTEYEGVGDRDGEPAVKAVKQAVRAENKKAFKNVARKQAEKIVEAAKKNPHGLCGKTVKQIVAERAKRNNAIKVS